MYIFIDFHSLQSKKKVIEVLLILLTFKKVYRLPMFYSIIFALHFINYKQNLEF